MGLCSQAGLMEAARGVRFAKQNLSDMLETRALPSVPDAKVDVMGM